MFKFICDLFYKRVYVKKGDRLECVTWGKEWVEIEVINVSEDKMNFMYKFIIAKGNPIHKDIASTYDKSINYLNDVYKLID